MILFTWGRRKQQYPLGAREERWGIAELLKGSKGYTGSEASLAAG